MQYSCRGIAATIAGDRSPRFLCSPSDKFLRLHGDSEGTGSSRVPASRDTSFSAVAPATSLPKHERPRSGPCHSRSGLVALSGPTSQRCYEYKPLISPNPSRLSFATAQRRWHALNSGAGAAGVRCAHPGCRPRAAECLSTGYWLTRSPGREKTKVTGPPGLSHP